MALRISIKKVFYLLRPNLLSFNRTMAGYPIKDIKFEDLKTMLDEKKTIIIDVREPQELKEDGKIPNSVNIPLGDIVDAFQLPDSTFLNKYSIPKPEVSQTFTLSCRSGKRATVAFNKIYPLGYENALVYLGSFQDWVKNCGTVEK